MIDDNNGIITFLPRKRKLHDPFLTRLCELIFGLCFFVWCTSVRHILNKLFSYFVHFGIYDGIFRLVKFLRYSNNPSRLRKAHLNISKEWLKCLNHLWKVIKKLELLEYMPKWRFASKQLIRPKFSKTHIIKSHFSELEESTGSTQPRQLVDDMT